MALHPQFSTSPYSPLLPDQRWFPATEDLRATAHEKLLSPLEKHESGTLVELTECFAAHQA